MGLDVSTISDATLKKIAIKYAQDNDLNKQEFQMMMSIEQDLSERLSEGGVSELKKIEINLDDSGSLKGDNMTAINNYSNTYPTKHGKYTVGLTKKDASKLFGPNNTFVTLDKDKNEVLSLEEILTARRDYCKNYTRTLGAILGAEGLCGVALSTFFCGKVRSVAAKAGIAGIGLLSAAIGVWGASLLLGGNSDKTKEAQAELDRYKNDSQALMEDSRYK